MKRCLAIAALTLMPGVLFAQETAKSWPGLDPARLPTVFVLDDTGLETQGKLLRLDADALVILVGGVERRFEAGNVKRIEKRDSIRNGAIIGAVVGTALGLISGGVADCPGDDPGGSCPGARAGLVLISTGVYAAIGTGIDALIHGRTTIYEASGPRSPTGQQGRAGSPTPSSLEGVSFNLRFRW